MRNNFWSLMVPLLGMLVATLLLLHANGRLWMASDGSLKVWIGDAWSSGNSQHLSDPYSFSHVQHGFVFGVFFSWLLGKRMKWQSILLICVALECGWELLENSSWVIDRYRETAAQGYEGDTVINSLSDILCCVLGFLVFRKIGVRYTVLLFVLIEIVMLIWIRDSFLLNVLMLLYPFEAIRQWQIGT